MEGRWGWEELVHIPEVLEYTSLRVMAWHLSTRVHCGNPHELFSLEQGPVSKLMATLFSGYVRGRKEKGFNHDRGAEGSHGGCPCSGPRGPGACNEDVNGDS